MIYNSVDTSSDKPIIHFSHANSFPAASYRQLFNALSDDFQILAIDKFGHDERYPVNGNWDNQVDELIDFISTFSHRPVISIGHSLGGVIAFKAACKKPSLFSQLILLDPPIITGIYAKLFQIAKLTPLIDKLTPSGKSKIRKTEWAASADLIDYFSSRALFRNMPKTVIQDYIDAAMIKADGCFKLSFRADVETALFRNVPHDLSRYAGRLDVPAKLISAERSTVYSPKLVSQFFKNNQIKHEVFEGVGHLFPLDHPIDTASFIKRQVNQNLP